VPITCYIVVEIYQNATIPGAEAMNHQIGEFAGHNRGQSFPVEVLMPEEVRSLMDACSRRAPTGIRNRALLALMYRGALRIGEALALKPKDIDLDAGTVTVLHGKGDKRRVVGLDDGVLGIIQAWIATRKTHKLNGRHRLFCTLNSKPVSQQYVRAMLQRIANRAGVEKRVHPHAFRHTCASEMRAEGIDIGVISKHLGHSNIAVTARYLDHLNPVAVVDAVQARTWDAE
jgi:site-specific recombinase XerD